MQIEKIKQLAKKFRKAIEAAKCANEFNNNDIFNRFPRGCCGITSELLGEYLIKNGIETIVVSSNCGEDENNKSHAWLVIKDDKIKKPTQKKLSLSYDLREIMIGYGAQETMFNNDGTLYEENDICDGVIIDITADQFVDYNKSVYVGEIDDFHKLFKFSDAHDFKSFEIKEISSLSEVQEDNTLENLYKIIEKYL